jgi:hypothetical protein
MRDLYSNLGARLGLAAAVQSASVEGPAIDLQGFESAAFVISTGAIAGSGDFSAKLQESDTSGGTYTDVAEDQVDSDAPETLAASSAYRLGYRGHKRFVRLALVKAGGTSIAAGATAVLGGAHTRPVA